MQLSLLIFVLLGFVPVTVYAQTPDQLPPAPAVAWLQPIPAVTSPVTARTTAPMAAVNFDCATVSQIPQAECAALVALYNSTNGPNWTNSAGWLVTTTPCTWFRITCANGRVVKVDLWQNNLSGTLPTELANLTALQSLLLQANQLTGALPPALGNLSVLESLGLWDNQLTGAIPSQWGNLTNLKWLWLSRNQVTGAIPTQLGNLTNLIDLSLDGNRLSGAIPAELGNLAHLQTLSLGNNQLSGAIPAQLGNLTNLSHLGLGDNQLSGALPTQLGNLTNLQELHLYNNQLSGAIPAQLGNLTALLDLNLNTNRLSGAIPTQLGNLVDLYYLDLSFNQLSGTIPAALGNLTALQSLYLNSNQLSGAMPAQLGNLRYLNELNFFNNQLSGAIPTELGNLSNLYTFDLSYNQLSGAIPATLGNLTALQELNLYHNQLSGAIPTQLGNLTALQGLYLHYNQLNGVIPAQVGNLSNLSSLYLANNLLSGAIPVEIGNLGKLEELLLNNNALSGALPAQVGNLTALYYLDLTNNQLSGTLPLTLSNLTNLSLFYFGNTNLCEPSGLLAWLTTISDLQRTNLPCTTNARRVGGSVSYRTATRTMAGVTVALSGASQSQATTTSSGAYSFTLQASGVHTVTPSLSGQVNSISAFDAAYVAQCVAGVRATSDCPLLAADASGNNVLSAFDAAQIAQYVAGLAAPTSRVGRWVFSPTSRSYNTLTTDLLAEGYAAYLVGEVSGNWQAPAVSVTAASATGPAPLLATSRDDLAVALGSAAPVGDLLAFQLTLYYDPAVGRLQAAQPSAALAAADWELLVNEATPGVVELVGYGVTPVQDSRELVTLHFLDAAGQPVALTPTLRQIQFNEEPLWLDASATPDALHQRQFLPLIVN